MCVCGVHHSCASNDNNIVGCRHSGERATIDRRNAAHGQQQRAKCLRRQQESKCKLQQRRRRWRRQRQSNSSRSSSSSSSSSRRRSHAATCVCSGAFISQRLMLRMAAELLQSHESSPVGASAPARCSCARHSSHTRCTSRDCAILSGSDGEPYLLFVGVVVVVGGGGVVVVVGSSPTTGSFCSLGSLVVSRRLGWGGVGSRDLGE